MTSRHLLIIATALIMIIAGALALGTPGAVTPRSVIADGTPLPHADAGTVSVTVAALPPGGQAIVASNCARCHPAGSLERMTKSRTEWEAALARMEALGVQLTGSERAAVLDYLATAEGTADGNP